MRCASPLKAPWPAGRAWIAQANLLQQLQRPRDGFFTGEKCLCLVDRHLQDFGNVAAVPQHLQRGLVVAGAMAGGHGA